MHDRDNIEQFFYWDHLTHYQMLLIYADKKLSAVHMHVVLYMPQPVQLLPMF